MATIYLDNNATTAVDPRVVEAILPYFTEQYGNPSSLHALGESAAQALAQARAQVARLLNAPARRIVFTSGATESNLTALRAALASAKERRRIVTSAVEHAAVLEPTARLEREGFEVLRVGVDGDGRLRLDELERAVDERCALVSVMWANNETGVVHDLAAVRAACQRSGAKLHIDAVQAVGRLPLDATTSGADYLALSGHKFHAPKGVGALYVRDDERFEALLAGGGQEHERRGGTENIPGIVGLGAAAKLARAWVEGPGPRELGELRDSFEDELSERLEGLEFHGRAAARVPNTSNFRVEGVSGEALTQWLAAEGVCVSTGAACSASRHKPSHVLLALGLTPAQASGSVRVSLSRFTAPAELERAAELVVSGVERLRALAAP
jgi:cysteine desulfurase